MKKLLISTLSGVCLTAMSVAADATARPGFRPGNTAKQNLSSMQHVAPGVPNVISNQYNSNGQAVGGVTGVVTTDPTTGVTTVTTVPVTIDPSTGATSAAPAPSLY